MQRHILSLLYDGRRASRGALGTSVTKQVIAGAQMFLGAHAHYYLEGRIPEKINDHGRGFDIEYLAREGECCITDFAIDIQANGIWDVAQFGFGPLVWESYKAWRENRVFENPPFERREPILAMPDDGNAPAFDTGAWDIGQRQRLHRRLCEAVPLITAPNGSSSSEVAIYLDGKLLDRIVARLSIDEQITQALVEMRARREPVGGVPPRYHS